MNNFFEKYNTALWMLVAAIWFFTGLFFQEDIQTFAISGGCFWTALAIFEFVKVKLQK